MLALLQLRWGYDGGGIACGPVSGSCLVEAMVRDSEGHYFFVMDSRFDNYDKITVSRFPPLYNH